MGPQMRMIQAKKCSRVCRSTRSPLDLYSLAPPSPLRLGCRKIPFIISFIVFVRSFENIANPTPKLRHSLMMGFMTSMRMYGYDNLHWGAK